MDFFQLGGKSYLAVADKYSGWLSILHFVKDSAQNVVKALRDYFAVFGVSEIVCTDGATAFTASEVQEFFRIWGVEHRVSSAYHPTSNKRAEIAVKSAKRLVRDNLGPGGALQSDKMLRALLAHRNTPDAVTGLSPASIVFGRQLRDHIPRRSYVPQLVWSEVAQKREEAFLKRHYANAEKVERGARVLKELNIGDHVYIQDQYGNSPRKWSKSGVIVESAGYDSFIVKVDGSGKVTRRNRQFLRRFTPFQSSKTIAGVEKVNCDENRKIECVGEYGVPEILGKILDSPLSSAVAISSGEL